MRRQLEWDATRINSAGAVMRRELGDLAIFLVAAWRLAFPNEPRMPTSGIALDAAIEAVAQKLPERYRKLLHFGDTRVGRRCYELQDVIALARNYELLRDSNPTYKRSEVAI